MSRGALDTLRSRRGGPRYVEAGKSVRYNSADIARWIEAQRSPPAIDKGLIDN